MSNNELRELAAKAVLSLDVAGPWEVAPILRKAADDYRQSASDLNTAWQDKSSGAAWLAIANILDHAANKAERAVKAAGLDTTPQRVCQRIADRIDGYDRDDLGESPDH